MNDTEVLIFSPRIDREQFIGYVNGIILKFVRGRGYVVDEEVLQRALLELEAGGSIVLTQTGSPISIVEVSGNEYVERAI